MARETSPEKPAKRFGGFGATWKAAGTGIAVLASGVALVFTLWPGLVPDPHTVLAAKVDVQAVDRNVSKSDYLRRYQPRVWSQTKAQTRKDEQGFPGDVIFLRVQTQGRKHSHVKLETVLYDWKSRTALPEPSQLEGWRADTPDDEWIAPVWVADPAENDFFARLMLEDGSTILAFADSPRIAAAP